ISPDGKAVLTASLARPARLWDAETGKQLHVFKGHTSDVMSAAFSPDGKRVLTGGHDRTARLWDAETGKELRRFHGESAGLRAVGFSQDGKRLLTSTGEAHVWDGEAGRELRRVARVQGGAALAFSADGRRVVSTR